MKKTLRLLALLTAMLLVLPAAACKLTDEDPAASVDDTKPVATIGGTYHVTRGDFQQAYDTILSQYASYGMSAPTADADVESMQDSVLDMMIDDKILEYQAEAMGITLTKEQLDGIDADVEDEMEYYLASFRAQALSEGATDVETRANEIFNEQLAAAGMDMDMEGFRAYIKEELTKTALTSAVEEKVKAAVTVTDDEVRTYYDDLLAAQTETYGGTAETYLTDMENYERYGGDPILVTPAGYVRVKTVMIAPTGTLGEDYTTLTGEMAALEAEYGKLALTDAAGNAARMKEIVAAYAEKKPQADALYETYIKDARAKAEEAVAAIAGGLSFDEAIEKYGEDEIYTDYPIFLEKGLLMQKGVVSSTWTQEMVDAVGLLKDGEVSPLITVGDSYYILQLVGDEAAGNRAFEDVEDEVRVLAQAEKAESAWAAQQEAWRNDTALVETFEDAYRDIGKQG